MRKWTSRMTLGGLVLLVFSCGDFSDGAGGDGEGQESTGPGESGDDSEETADDGETSGSDDSSSSTGSPDVPEDECGGLDPCGSDCCDHGTVCIANSCAELMGPCWDDTDCDEGTYCEYELPAALDPLAPGCHRPPHPVGTCLESPPLCSDEGQGEDCVGQCEANPMGDLDPLEQWSWDAANVMSTPLIVQLDDDDCNGTIDRRDIPDIVFTSFEDNTWEVDGTLHVATIIDGQLVLKWSLQPDEHSPYPGVAMAVGDVDGNPGAEIVTCTEDGRVRAYDSDGVGLWLSEADKSCLDVLLVDLDDDGSVEVVTNRYVLEGETGAQLAELLAPVMFWGSHVVVGDLDEDGFGEIVVGGRVFASDGTLLANTTFRSNFASIADLDDDGAPEILSVTHERLADVHELQVWRYAPEDLDGFEVLREAVDATGGVAHLSCPNGGGGGPLTLGDVTGDGTPDVGISTRGAYAMFDGSLLADLNVPSDQTLLWSRAAEDCSSGSVASSMFDLDGDGVLELLHGDQEYFRILDGSDGSESARLCNTNGTLREYPVIVDADNDGSANIIYVANDYNDSVVTGFCPLDFSVQRGVRIFGATDGAWATTPTVWNQHYFHVTNVAENGSISSIQPSHWEDPDTNAVRQATASGSRTSPDLEVAEIWATCGEGDELEYELFARVRNLGQRAAPGDAVVGFYSGEPNDGGLELDSTTLGSALLPGTERIVSVLIDDPPGDLIQGDEDAHVDVNVGWEQHKWRECDYSNNVHAGSGVCP